MLHFANESCLISNYRALKIKLIIGICSDYE
uniref:Uncharacterized protein n=1 Tax=Rhizophora mucronata TaxID=61149 RepID=A0A2P2QNX1_RHIMU